MVHAKSGMVNEVDTYSHKSFP